MNQSLTMNSEQKSLTLLHEKMISLLNDTKSFEQYIKSPQIYLSQCGELPSYYLELLSSINLAGLVTFRRITRGTRELRLKQVFNNLYEKIGSEPNWQSIIEQFLDSVIITNGRDDSDLTLFAEFIRSTNNVAMGDLATLERTVYAVSNSYVDIKDKQDKLKPENDLLLNPWVELVTTSSSAKALLNSDLNSIPKSVSGVHHTLVYRSRDDGDIRLRALVSELGLQLSKSRCLSIRELSDYGKLAAEIDRLWADGCFQYIKSSGHGT